VPFAELRFEVLLRVARRALCDTMLEKRPTPWVTFLPIGLHVSCTLECSFSYSQQVPCCVGRLCFNSHAGNVL
jgi:hypothetical protein